MFDYEASNRDNDAALDAQERPSHREQLEWATDWFENAPFEELADDVLEAWDGCSVEPDGICPDGYRSPLLLLGIV